jgi:hypothetical protein
MRKDIVVGDEKSQNEKNIYTQKLENVRPLHESQKTAPLFYTAKKKERRRFKKKLYKLRPPREMNVVFLNS